MSARARRALLALAEHDPAVAALSLWVVHKDGDTGALTATSAPSTVTYGAPFEALSPPEQIGVVAHHVLHVALRHGSRLAALRARLGGGFTEYLGQLAADALVNETLMLAEYALPRPAVRLADLIPAALGDDAPARISDWDLERLYFALADPPAGQSKDGQDRRGARAAAEAYGQDRAFSPDLEAEAHGASAEDDASADAAWRQRLAAALAEGRASGRGVGQHGHALADLPAPRVPWEHHLRALVARAVEPEPQRSPTRPCRHWLAADSLARQQGTAPPPFQAGPSRQRGIPRLAVAVDMSGSVADTVLTRFAAEVSGIARRARAEIVLLPFDDGIHGVQIFAPGEAVGHHLSSLDWARGGGTSFDEPLAEAQRQDASAIVVLTDLDAPVGERTGRMPVIWAVPGDLPQEPPFGRVVSLIG